MENHAGEGAEFAFLMERANVLGNPPEIRVAAGNREILQELGSQVAEIAARPEQADRRRQWTRLNELDAERPMVWLNDICWSEINVNDELTPLTSSAFCRNIETELRQRIYWWTHMPGDMVVEPVICAPMVVEDTGIGIEIEEETRVFEAANEVVSHEFHKVITTDEDVEMIEMPRITHRENRSCEVLDAYRHIFDGVLEVAQRGFLGFNFSPWDHLVRLTGVQDALMNLALRPEYTESPEGIGESLERSATSGGTGGNRLRVLAKT